MLRRSFVHIPGVGPTKERKLWEKGIHDWDHLLQDLPRHFKEDKHPLIRDTLKRSTKALESGDLHFFYQAFPRDALWRLVPRDLDRIAYLDIETTGMGHPPACESTTITFYFQGQVLQAHSHREKKAMIRWILGECSLLVTFFGEAFDVPFLKAEYGLDFDVAHIDLCFWLKRLGYKGGLKAIQKLFHDIPARESMDIDGYDAVRLWRMHLKGVPGALETLLTYNAEDTVVLEPLLVKAYNMEVEKHPGFGLKPMKARPLPSLKTSTSAEVYAMLRGDVPRP